MLQRIFRCILTFLRRVWGDQPVGWATLLPGLLLTALLLALPTGYEGAVIYQAPRKSGPRCWPPTRTPSFPPG